MTAMTYGIDSKYLVTGDKAGNLYVWNENDLVDFVEAYDHEV